MKATGIVRRIDDLGRVVIPKQLLGYPTFGNNIIPLFIELTTLGVDFMKQSVAKRATILGEYIKQNGATVKILLIRRRIKTEICTFSAKVLEKQLENQYQFFVIYSEITETALPRSKAVSYREI